MLKVEKVFIHDNRIIVFKAEEISATEIKVYADNYEPRIYKLDRYYQYLQPTDLLNCIIKYYNTLRIT